MVRETGERTFNAKHEFKNRAGQNSSNKTVAVAQKGKPEARESHGPRKPKCQLCEAPYWTSDCRKYASKKDRLYKARECKLCTKCLQKAHKTVKCNKTMRCFKCKENHNTAICDKMFQKKVMSVTQSGTNLTGDTADETEVVTACCRRNHKQVLLLTSNIIAQNPNNGIKRELVTFFDARSELSFITKAAAKRLGLSTGCKHKLSLTTFGSNIAQEQNSEKFTILLTQSNGEAKHVSVNSVDKLTKKLLIPTKTESTTDAEIKTKKLEPDLLIGADNFFEIINVGKKLPSGFQEIESTVGPMLCRKGNIAANSVKREVEKTEKKA